MWIWIIIFTALIILIIYVIYSNTFTYDFARIIKSKPLKIIKVINYRQLKDILRNNLPSLIRPETLTKSVGLISPEDNTGLQPLSIAGGKFSHGGQTMLDDSIQLDMSGLNKIISLNSNVFQIHKTVTVQSGVRWKDLQAFLDEKDLSVSEMQSYSNFTVGGSLSVNCHGRGLNFPTIAESVVDMKVMLSDGEIMNCSRKLNKDLFKATIGGYGCISIILEATLKVVPNEVLARKIFTTHVKEIPSIIEGVISDRNIEFYNCNIYPFEENKAVHIFFMKTNLDTYDFPRLRNHRNYYWGEMIKNQLLRRIPFTKELRAYYEPKQLEKIEFVNRNYEMNYDVNELEPLLKFPSTSILQEYFVPLENLLEFLDNFWIIIQKHKVNLLNLSIRYVGYSDEPVLNYTNSNHTIALVLYLNIWNNTVGLKDTEKWTQEMIDLALKLNGSYYLPYLPFASKEQFREAYPSYEKFLRIKNKFDPENRLRNMFSDKYLCL